MCEAPGCSGEGGWNLHFEVHQPHDYLCEPLPHTVKLSSNAYKCPTRCFAAYADSVHPDVVKQQYSKRNL